MQPRVRAAFLDNYFEVARFVGLDPHAMLKWAGIDEAILSDPDHMLPGAPALALLEETARRSGNSSIGLLMAEARTLASMGAIALLLKHEGTARDVLDAMVQYQVLLSEALAIRVEEAGDATMIHCGFRERFGGRQAIEYLTGMIARVTSHLTGGRWRAESVHFVHDSPDNLSAYRRIFHCPIAFQSEFDGLVCATELLDAPNPEAEAILARHAQRYLDMLFPHPQDGAITERARRSIYLLLPAGRATLEQVADNLDVHPRMLQRRLEKEGRTFALLLNEVRRELAQRYLSSSTHQVTVIAQMTGYAAPSSFTRWFCTEFGVSPAAWRAERQMGAPAETPNRAA